MSDRSHGVSRSPMHLLHLAERVARRLFAAKAMGSITPRQLEILIAVSEQEGLSQNDLAKRTGIDRNTVGEIIVRLVRKGFLQRRRSRKDARANVLHLTDEAQRLLAAHPVAQNIDALLLAALPAAQREPFLDALQAIIRNLEAAR